MAGKARLVTHQLKGCRLMMSTQTTEQTAYLRQILIKRSIKSRELIHHELNIVPRRILDETGGQLRLTYDEKVFDFLLNEMAAASHRRSFVKQAIEQHLIRPLLRLIYTGQVAADEMLSIELADNGKMLYFVRMQDRQSRISQLL